MKTLLLSLAVVLAQPQGGGRGPGGSDGPRRPPQEALSACQGQSAGAACRFTHDGRSMEGTCFTPASDKPLACRPSGPPPNRH